MGHHPPFNRQRAHEGPCQEEKTLVGQHEWLDQFVEGLKKRSSGRGVMPTAQAPGSEADLSSGGL